MYIQQTLNLAILQVSRFGRTGDTMPGQTAAATASSLIAQYTFGFVTNPTLTVTPYSSFSAIPKDAQGNIIYPNNGTQNFGATNQIVLYSLSYEWKFYTPLVGTLLSPTGNGRIMLIASTVLQNEPF